MEHDGEIIAAHAYYNQEIKASLLIERINERTYHVYRLNHAVLATATTYIHAIELADMYLAGYTSGYDEGIQHASKSEDPHP